MVEVYSKMKPDAFPSQLQNVLTAYYEDIKGVVSASGCNKSKVVKSKSGIIKRKFEDQDDTRLAPEADAAYACTAAPTGAADAATPASPGWPGAQSSTRRGRASSFPQPCGQGRERQGARGREW